MYLYMNKFIKIFLIILVLNFLFKNKKVEKFSAPTPAPDYSNNVTYRMIECDTPCGNPFTWKNKIYQTCMVGGNRRYCLSKKDLNDSCALSTLDDKEKKICRKSSILKPYVSAPSAATPPAGTPPTTTKPAATQPAATQPAAKPTHTITKHGKRVTLQEIIDDYKKAMAIAGIGRRRYS